MGFDEWYFAHMMSARSRKPEKAVRAAWEAGRREEAIRWGTGICSHHNPPVPDCNICNPRLKDDEQKAQWIEAGRRGGLEEAAKAVCVLCEQGEPFGDKPDRHEWVEGEDVCRHQCAAAPSWRRSCRLCRLCRRM